MNAQELSQLESLLTAMVESRLTDDERGQLRALLRGSAAARRYYARYLFVHGALAWRSIPASSGAAQRESAAADGGKPLPREKRAAPLAARRVAFTSLVSAALAVALLVTAMAFMAPPIYRSMTSLWDRQPLPEPVVVAQLTGVENAQWADGQIGTQVGSHLVVGHQLQLRSGLAEISYRRGTKLIVEGPAELVISGENSSNLAQGKIAASVPPAAIGFSVVTPLARIVDLGTEFGVAASADGAAEIQVFAGSVEAAVRSADGQWRKAIVIGANQQAKVDAASRSLVVGFAAQAAFARHVAAPEFELGSALGAYGNTDTVQGVTLIYGALAKHSGQAQEFAFYSTKADVWVTPLLFAFDAKTATYRITGIGQSIASDGSGRQSASFTVVAGSAEVTAGVHTFGMFDGRVAADDAGDAAVEQLNNGVIAADLGRGPWLYAYGDPPRHVRLGRSYSFSGADDELLHRGRTYAARLVVLPPPPPSTTKQTP